MSSVQSSNKPIQLQWNGGAVVITPEDEDRFVKEAQWAVTACQGVLSFERHYQVRWFAFEDVRGNQLN
jgi:hypothetical protein